MRWFGVAAVALGLFAAGSCLAQEAEPVENDIKFWSLIRWGDPEYEEYDLRVYLSRFPHGLHADEARKRRAEKRPVNPAGAPTLKVIPFDQPKQPPKAQPRSAAKAQPKDPPLIEALKLIRDDPEWSDRIYKDYTVRYGGKAIAADLQKHEILPWYSSDDGTASTYALELCQMRSQRPCLLLAQGEDVFDPRTQEPRDMPRLKYRGPYDPTQVPLQGKPPSAALLSYPSLPNFKSIAIGIGERQLNVSVGAKTQADADAAARYTCDLAGTRPCVLYASGMTVVYPFGR